jgi:hypothetical protein
MDNPDIGVDIAQDDLRGAGATTQDRTGRSEHPAPLAGDTRVTGGAHVAPLLSGALVGNPRRVRL